MRTRIKVCGITTLGDAQGVVAAGVDAVGFVFAKSPRQVAPDEAGRIIALTVPPFVTPVGVFVDAPVEEVAGIARQARLGAVQLHGSESLAYLDALRAVCPARIIKAFRVREFEDIFAVCEYRGHCDAVLLDAYVPGVAGGTGQTFNWEHATAAKAYEVPVLLAGGLTPENVGDAVRQVRPWAVDLSSGVEAAPGRKDQEKVHALVEAVREADREA